MEQEISRQLKTVRYVDEKSETFTAPRNSSLVCRILKALAKILTSA